MWSCWVTAATTRSASGSTPSTWSLRRTSTEIDLAATLKAKIDADVAPQVILGACRPPLAHAAVQAEPSIGLLLPCNVVVRSLGDGTTLVEAMDPAVVVTLTRNENLVDVAADARDRLTTALTSLAGSLTA